MNLMERQIPRIIWHQSYSKEELSGKSMWFGRTNNSDVNCVVIRYYTRNLKWYATFPNGARFTSLDEITKKLNELNGV